MDIADSIHTDISITSYYATLIQSLCDIAESYHYLGRLDDALEILKIGEQLVEAKEVSQQDRMKLLLQHGSVLVANYFLTNRDYDLTLSTAQYARQVTEAAHDARGIADALDLVGQTYYYKSLNTPQGEFDEALEYFQQALERREALQDTRGTSESLFHIGLIYENGDTPDIDKAYTSYTRAYQLAEEHNYKLEASYAARHLAGIAYDKEGPERGLKYALKSLSLREEIGFKRTLPASHLLVGELYSAQNDLARALLHYQKAYHLAEEMELKIALMSALLAIGDVHLAQKDVLHARTSFEKAHALAQELNIVYGIAEASKRLMQLKGVSDDGTSQPEA